MKLKIRKATRIYKNEGLLSLGKEIGRFVIKPLRLLREKIAWFFLVRRSRDKEMMAVVNGRTMYLSRQDSGISRELAIYGVHEPLATQTMKDVIVAGTTVVDIGANIGYYLLLESLLLGPTGKILAIEPSSDNVRLLKLNVEANAVKNVTVVEAAIGDYDGIGKLYLSKAANWHSLIPQDELQQTTFTEIQVRQLDSLVEELGIEVSLIRMDIEGYEVNALKGMIHTLQKHTPALVIELHPQLIGPEKICDLLRTLKDIGYEVTHAINRRRDYPWCYTKYAIETPSIDSLLNDPRILKEKRQFMVFFQPCRNAG